MHAPRKRDDDTGQAALRVVELKNGRTTGKVGKADVYCLRVGGQGNFTAKKAGAWVAKTRSLDAHKSKRQPPQVAAPLVIVFMDPLEVLAPEKLRKALKERQDLVNHGAVVFDRSENEGGCTDAEAVRAMLTAHAHVHASPNEGGLAAVCQAVDFSKDVVQQRGSPAYGRFPAQVDPAEMEQQLQELADWYRRSDWYEMD